MRNVILLILIIAWWFLLGTGLTYMASDPSINNLQLTGNNSYDLTNSSAFFNISTDAGSAQASAGGFLDMTVRMFSFRIPDAILPASLNFILSFFNWVLLTILILIIYRLANPFA